MASSINSSKYYFEKCKQISSNDLAIPERKRGFSEIAKHDVLVSKSPRRRKKEDTATIQDLLKEGELLFPVND